MSLCHTSLQCSMTCAVLDYSTEQGNRRLHFARDVHSPSPPIGDAAYRQRAGGGPNHGHSRGVARNVFGGINFYCTILQSYMTSSPAISAQNNFQGPILGGYIYRYTPSVATPQGHRQQAQKLGKHRACGSGDILVDRQTHRQTYLDGKFARTGGSELLAK